MDNPESKYKVVKKIGKGSYGTVFKVKRKSDEQIFAMKIIKLNKTDKKEIEGILNEIRILCSMDNKYICGYEEAFLSRNQKEMCIIMEYVGGGDLQEKIEECKKRRVQFNEEIIWKYLCQSLLGLQCLHKTKIIHRDIKAANIFLTKDFTTIKIGDLGVAKVAKQNFAQTQIGTPYYLAPEIWNSQKYDYRCDIFSLGVVIYELASLQVPFNGVSLQDLCSKIKRGIIRRIPRSFSDDLYEIIKIMLTTDFKKRPNASQLLQNPVIKKQIQKLGLCDLQEDKENIDQLMATIVMPKNIAQLKGKLPSKKKYRAQSCQRLNSVDSVNESSPKNNIEQYLNKLQKKRKELKDKSMNSQKKNLPPVKSIKNKPLVRNSFAKKSSNKKSQKKVLNYQEYLKKLNQYQEKQQERKQRRMNSADVRSRPRNSLKKYLMSTQQEVNVSNLHQVKSKHVTITPLTKKAMDLTGYSLSDFFIPKQSLNLVDQNDKRSTQRQDILQQGLDKKINLVKNLYQSLVRSQSKVYDQENLNVSDYYREHKQKQHKRKQMKEYAQIKLVEKRQENLFDKNTMDNIKDFRKKAVKNWIKTKSVQNKKEKKNFNLYQKEYRKRYSTQQKTLKKNDVVTNNLKVKSQQQQILQINKRKLSLTSKRNKIQQRIKNILKQKQQNQIEFKQTKNKLLQQYFDEQKQRIKEVKSSLKLKDFHLQNYQQSLKKKDDSLNKSDFLKSTINKLQSELNQIVNEEQIQYSKNSTFKGHMLQMQRQLSKKNLH